MHSLSDFMCIHSEKGKAEAEACYARVLEDLQTTPDQLLSAVVYSAEFDTEQGTFALYLTGFDADQWAAVSANVLYYDEQEGRHGAFRREPHAQIYVQCDIVEQAWHEYGS